jgi:hypothetical protein
LESDRAGQTGGSWEKRPASPRRSGRTPAAILELMLSKGLDHTSIATTNPGHPAEWNVEQPGFVLSFEHDGNRLHSIHRAQPLP